MTLLNTAFKELGTQAVALHKARDFAEAEPLYLRMIAAAPDNPMPRHYLGILKSQTGRHAEAADLLASALRLRPDVPETLFHHANVLQHLGQSAEALASYDSLLALRPDHITGLNNRGSALQSLKRYTEALASYDHALALKPDYGEAIYNRASALHELDRLHEALAGYDAALAMAPRHAAALNNRGNVLHRLGRLQEALDSLDRALAARPDHADAFYNRGRTLCAMNRIGQGFESFTRAAMLYAQGTDTPLHLEGGARIPAATVNPPGDAGAAAAWQGGDPAVMVVDDILAPPALEALRHFCLGSTIWRAAQDDGVARARPESGLACPLLAQVAEELRDVFPAVLQDHALLHFWATRHDGSPQDAVLQADEAAVSVHLWLTPDTANLDAHEGLVVWDKVAASDRDFVRASEDAAMARKYLAASGAQALPLAYRANRAVILGPGLLSEISPIPLSSGDEHHRISITLQFGARPSS